MIDGLKLAFTGEEIIRAIDERIAGLEGAIQFKRDEIDGKIEPKGDVGWQTPVETVQDEIRVLQHRVDVLTMYRGRIMPAETYLLGRRAVRWANLLPPEPPAPEIDPDSEIRWVTRSV